MILINQSVDNMLYLHANAKKQYIHRRDCKKHYAGEAGHESRTCAETEC